jgi:uncharacterized protein
MIIPDLNLLLYAYFEHYPQHAAAKRWWESVVNGKDMVGIVPPVAFGFVRLSTNRKVYAPPVSVEEALRTVESWFLRANVHWLVAGPENLEIAFRLLRSEGAAGDLTTDAQIAAFALEHRALLCSNDVDFARFEGLRWSNPLEGSVGTSV